MYFTIITKIGGKKLSIKLAYAPATPLLGTHPGELKTRSHKNLCTYVSLGIIFNNQSLKYPSADEGLNTVVCVYLFTHKKERSTDPGCTDMYMTCT